MVNAMTTYWTSWTVKILWFKCLVSCSCYWASKSDLFY